MLLNKILVANRGEIACRVIRTCQDMGIATVAVYSDADKNAQHVQIADEAVYIGASPASESYLNIDAIVNAAMRTSTDAIHPGYGFLSENPQFAYAVVSNGMTFIGPSPSAMEVMGNKRTSKIVLQDVPYVPGYFEGDQSNDRFTTEAETIGYPLMVKAAAGGGGKGMRIVNQSDELVPALEACRREAKQAFNDDNLMLEKVVEFPRHIEIQIFGDYEGNIIALGERECSIQRRYQKIIEESPSSMMTPELRKKMCDVAVNIGKQIGYYGAGTVEFLVDDDENFYFMEMNARLQVEHPVTEMVTGFDLVRWQIEVARGVILDDLLPDETTAETYVFEPLCHAIEARVYAEDPTNQFLPSIGRIVHWSAPDFVRSDIGIQSGDEITTHYDPMVAKIITYGTTRLEAIRRLDYGLSKVQLLGVRNNIAFLRRVLTHVDHLGGIIHTGFLNEYSELMDEPSDLSPIALIAVALAKQPYDGHWRNNPSLPVTHTFTYRDTPYQVAINVSQSNNMIVTIQETQYNVELVTNDGVDKVIVVDGHRQRVSVVEITENEWWVHSDDGTSVLQWQSPFPTLTEDKTSEGSLVAPMPGQILKVMVEEGQSVKQGETLMILEAMKMEHQITAPTDGTVESIFFMVGESVQQDMVLLELHQNMGEDTVV